MARSRKTDPSFARGFARSKGKSAYPDIWAGREGDWVPTLGKQGSRLVNLTKNKNAVFVNLDPATAWTIVKNRLIEGYFIEYNGTTHYLSIGDIDFTIGTGDFTVAGWMITTNSNTDIILATDGVIGNNFWLGKLSGAAAFSINGTTISGGSVTDGKIHQVRGERKAGDIRVYLDNVLVGGPTTESGTVTTKSYAIGKFGNASGTFHWPGKIGPVSIRSKALTASERTLEYLDPLGFLRLAEPSPLFVPAVAGAGTELFEIPHYMRGGFNPMHGGFSA